MNDVKVAEHIVNWMTSYAQNARAKGFVIGISGGVDSALTSTLCALTGLDVTVVSLPIHQKWAELNRADLHIQWLSENFPNVRAVTVELSAAFDEMQKCLPEASSAHFLAMANTRARLRMTTLYAVAQPLSCLVAGTGNKIEDFGVGFYTKYGDGGVDLSPIADLTKTQVRALARHLNLLKELSEAPATDGLWEDGRTDEDQLGATYPELEWAMDYIENNRTENAEETLTNRQKEVIEIYTRLNKQNQHKMNPIPVCIIPKELL
jgi:NAD+ synthase